jgi:H+/gluconate symporter-like permease
MMSHDECRRNPDRSGLLVWLAYRGWSILLLAPLIAALVANWTQTFKSNAAGFVGQFFPIFLLGALFGKLMEASGSVEAIAKYLMERLGTKTAMLAIVLAGEFVTYGGASLFVAFFVLAPMGLALFEAANIPQRLMAVAIAPGKKTPASVNRPSCCPGRTWVRRPPSPVAECSRQRGL